MESTFQEHVLYAIIIGIFFAVGIYLSNDYLEKDKRISMSIVVGVICFVSWIVGITMGRIYFGNSAGISIFLVILTGFILVKFAESFTKK